MESIIQNYLENVTYTLTTPSLTCMTNEDDEVELTIVCVFCRPSCEEVFRVMDDMLDDLTYALFDEFRGGLVQNVVLEIKNKCAMDVLWQSYLRVCTNQNILCVHTVNSKRDKNYRVNLS